MNKCPDPGFRLRSVLAVCAHPDDESFGLGAGLSAFNEFGIETRWSERVNDHGVD